MRSSRWRAVIGLLVVVGSAPVLAQATADEVEKNIAALPPDQRTYERFRFWVNSLPADQQQGADLDARYRTYLRGRGFSETDTDAQIKVVEAQSRRLEAERWNRILTAEKPAFNTK